MKGRAAGRRALFLLEDCMSATLHRLLVVWGRESQPCRRSGFVHLPQLLTLHLVTLAA